MSNMTLVDHCEIIENLKLNGNQRILLLDDEEFCLTGLKVILQAIGVDTKAKVDLCISASEALQHLKAAKTLGITYSLILTDIQMPGMSGIEFTKQAR